MIDPIENRRPPITPQLAVRVAVLGVLALVAFGVIFFRLWYLQVLSGEDYVKQAQDNRIRVDRIAAPRGAIVDRNGEVLVDNREATVLKLSPTSLPGAQRSAAAEWGRQRGLRASRPKGRRGPPVPLPPIATPALAARYARLSGVLGVSRNDIHRQVMESLSQVPYAAITIKTDVSRPVVNYIEERNQEFPGVRAESVFLRRYPERSLASQIVGTVTEVSPEQLHKGRYRSVAAGTLVGQEGLEYAYDRYLRGRDGKQRTLVDANANPKGAARSVDFVSGRQLSLTLDLDLQRTAERAVARGIQAARGFGNAADAGAFVAMSPVSGEIYALGSLPEFNPNVLARPISDARYKALFVDKAAGAPRFNRAISATYPTGSTFKPITALAGLDRQLRTPSTTISDGGCLRIGAADQPFCNAGEKPNGPVDLRRAIKVSSDVYFYGLGRDLNAMEGQPLQGWARRLGLGRRTGIDLPAETGGLVPDRAWRARVGRRELAYEKRTGKPCCTFSDKRPWTVGDNVNLSVGQGDLQATPLQMAVAYAAIANGGKVVRPHLGRDVRDSNGGALLRKIQPASARRVKLDPVARKAIMDGLHSAASEPGGTSYDVFSDWNQEAFPVYGKTGTAQRILNGVEVDQSWYVAYVPSKSKPIVVAVTVEKGGFGAESAAPAARQILARWFDQDLKFKAGKSRTR
jgi:penicillin-binding protein 2